MSDKIPVSINKRMTV